MVHVTERAAEQIRAVISRQAMPASAGLRFGLKDGGCSGYTYLLDFEGEASEEDLVHEQGGARVFIHMLHVPFLSGSTIHYKDGLLEAGFVVENPNVTRACGCGESVEF